MVEPIMFGKPADDDDVAKIQKEISDDVKSGLTNLGPVLINNKIQQQQIFAESVANGGPGNTQHAIALLMEAAGIKPRMLCIELNMPKKKVRAMLDGEIDMPIETVNRIVAMIERKKPGMLEKLRNKTFDD